MAVKAIKKVRRNIRLLRGQVFPEGTKYRFVLRTLWGPDSYDVVAKDTTEASVKLAEKLRMTEAELASILDEVWEYETGQWVKIFPVETKGSDQDISNERMKEAAKRFLVPFIRARGYLPQNPSAARASHMGFYDKKGFSSTTFSLHSKPFSRRPPVETKEPQARVKIGFKRCKLCGEEVEKYYAQHLVDKHGFRSPSYADVITNFETIWLKEGVFPETLRLKPLFDMQDSLTEHRFPHEKAQIIDTILSHTGDIYREMTHAYPHYGYVAEKWEKLSVYCARPPLSWLQAGDWEEIRTQLQDPPYKVQRNQYLSNLQRLREETLKMPMDPKRSTVMVESLDMIKALIFWFESLDPHAPPRQQLDRLTDAIANYFPQEFYRGVQIPMPPSVMAEALFRATSSIESLTSGLKSQFGYELKEMITQAEREKREAGAMLCCSPSGELHLGRACWGLRGKVEVHDCKDHLTPFGSFHVHLGGTEVFSVPDLELAIRKEGLSCLGYTKAGVPMLKCITPKRYYELPSESKAWVNRSLSQAKQDIETATRLFRESMTSSEAITLSQRAKATLSNIEQLLGAYEVGL